MFQQREEPRFTIEQIDLLQRLRRTGITQAEVLHALDTLDHIDRQHGHKLACKPSYVPPTSSLSSSNPAFASSSMTSTSTQTTFPEHRLSLSPTNNFDDASPPLPVPASPVMVPTVVQNGLVPITNGKLSPPRFSLGVVGGNVSGSGYTFEASEDFIDVDEKVEDLMRRDSAVIKEEIKSFLANRRISQAVVAQVTGISQSRISHWLLQQGSDLSEQKKRAFFRWYQLEKTNPGATLAMRAAPPALDDMVEWHQTQLPFKSAPTGFRLRRGSRFTWRKECLAVMEGYFSDNQYPDEAKREEIATACNAVIQKPGKKLSDLERVTSLKVYNWFANRRKDIKRRANIEAAILESHGIEVQSPGGQSVSDEVDGNDFPDQGCEASVLDKRASARQLAFSRADLSSPTQVPTPSPGRFSAVARGGTSGQRGISWIERGQRGPSWIERAFLAMSTAQLEGCRLEGSSWCPLSPSLQDEPGIHRAPSEPQDPAGLGKSAADGGSPASGGQLEEAGSSVGNEIKMEALEDD